MIPKKIHYVWLGGGKTPSKIKKCMKSWNKHLPDYEIVCWDENRFDINSVPWVKEAYEAKKYAFAADYIRCYALYTEGGIYLDTDVEVLKSFDPLLHLPYFMGKETGSPIESAVIGAEKGNHFYKLMLDYYNERHFKNGESLDTKALPYVMQSILNANYNVTTIDSLDTNGRSQDNWYLFPEVYFSPKHWETGKIKKTPDTFSIHHFEASWQSKRYRRGLKFKQKYPFIYSVLRKAKDFPIRISKLIKNLK